MNLEIAVAPPCNSQPPAKECLGRPEHCTRRVNGRNRFPSSRKTRLQSRKVGDENISDSTATQLADAVGTSFAASGCSIIGRAFCGGFSHIPDFAAGGNAPVCRGDGRHGTAAPSAKSGMKGMVASRAIMRAKVAGYGFASAEGRNANRLKQAETLAFFPRRAILSYRIFRVECVAF